MFQSIKNECEFCESEIMIKYTHIAYNYPSELNRKEYK